MTDTKEAKGLVRKLCEAGAAIGWIAKGGYNEFHKYSYATEADIVSALRKELFKRHVFVFPHILKYERVPIEVETLKWDDKAKAKMPSIRKTALTQMDIAWTFVDGESGEEKTVMVPGVGEDSVDKGLYKAFTGSEKYLLMKSFLLPTGDDPERDSKDDWEEAKTNGRDASRGVAQRKIKEAQERQSNRARTEAIFYTLPEVHNGHFAEFLNIPAFIADNQDKEEALRMVFTTHKGKKTAGDSVLVASERLPKLLEQLAGDVGVTVKQLRANGEAAQ